MLAIGEMSHAQEATQVQALLQPLSPSLATQYFREACCIALLQDAMLFLLFRIQS